MIDALRRRVRERDLGAETKLALKMTLGGTIAWWLAVALGAKRPIFAALVPLVAMTGDPFAAVSVSLGRIVGVFAGVGLGIAFAHVAMGSTLRVAIVLLLGTLASVALKVGGRPNIEVPVAALFMLSTAISAVDQFGVQRIWETAIGAGIAIVISALVWPPHPARALARQLDRLRRSLVDDLLTVADDLATGNGNTAARMDEVRANSLDAVREVFALDDAKRALRWSPLRRSDSERVAELGVRINLAARVYRHARALARDVSDIGLRDETLATATRDLADATDRILGGADAREPLARAEAALAAAAHGEAWVVAVQLRQLLADIQAMR